MPLSVYRRCGLFVVICAALLVFSGDAHAAERSAAGKVPTSISAGSMDYNANSQTVVFTGNVHVKRPDFELWAAKMTVFLDKSNKPAASPEAETGVGGMQAGDIDRIVAEKDVRLKSEDREGRCDKATYYAKEDRFVMEGSPVLHDKNKNTIKGTRIVHYLGKNRSEVQGHVDAVFFTPDNTERTPGAGGRTSAPAGGKK